MNRTDSGRKHNVCSHTWTVQSLSATLDTTAHFAQVVNTLQALGEVQVFVKLTTHRQMTTLGFPLQLAHVIHCFSVHNECMIKLCSQLLMNSLFGVVGLPTLFSFFSASRLFFCRLVIMAASSAESGSPSPPEMDLDLL